MTEGRIGHEKNFKRPTINLRREQLLQKSSTISARRIRLSRFLSSQTPCVAMPEELFPTDDDAPGMYVLASSLVVGGLLTLSVSAKSLKR